MVSGCCVYVWFGLLILYGFVFAVSFCEFDLWLLWYEIVFRVLIAGISPLVWGGLAVGLVYVDSVGVVWGLFCCC